MEGIKLPHCTDVAIHFFAHVSGTKMDYTDVCLFFFIEMSFTEFTSLNTDINKKAFQSNTNRPHATVWCVCGPGAAGPWGRDGSHVSTDLLMASWVIVKWDPPCGQTEWRTHTTEKNYLPATSLGCLPPYRGASEPTPTTTLPHVGSKSSHVKLSFASHVGKNQNLRWKNDCKAIWQLFRLKSMSHQWSSDWGRGHPLIFRYIHWIPI